MPRHLMDETSQFAAISPPKHAAPEQAPPRMPRWSPSVPVEPAHAAPPPVRRWTRFWRALTGQ